MKKNALLHVGLLVLSGCERFNSSTVPQPDPKATEFVEAIIRADLDRITQSAPTVPIETEPASDRAPTMPPQPTIVDPPPTPREITLHPQRMASSEPRVEPCDPLERNCQTTWNDATRNQQRLRLQMQLELEQARRDELERYALDWMDRWHGPTESSARIATRMRVIELVRTELRAREQALTNQLQQLDELAQPSAANIAANKEQLGQPQ